jgi:hypothetical protein
MSRLVSWIIDFQLQERLDWISDVMILQGVV